MHKPNIHIRHEMSVLYTTPPNQWLLVRISSSRDPDEIYYELNQLLEAILDELDAQHETLSIEVRNDGRKIYLRSVADQSISA